MKWTPGSASDRALAKMSDDTPLKPGQRLALTGDNASSLSSSTESSPSSGQQLVRVSAVDVHGNYKVLPTDVANLTGNVDLGKPLPGDDTLKLAGIRVISTRHLATAAMTNTSHYLL